MNFNNYDIAEMFGTSLPIVKDVVNTLHIRVIVQAA